MSGKSQHSREKFMIFCIVLAFIAMVTIGFFWNANSFYTQAYRPVVRESQARHQIQREARGRGSDSADTSDNEPHPFGLREKDIRKHQGNGYSTY